MQKICNFQQIFSSFLPSFFTGRKPILGSSLVFHGNFSYGFFFFEDIGAKEHREQTRNLDIFFTSVSASTVSSMGTIEMEVFSNSQLLVLTVLMLVGGEVFTSLLALQLARFKLKKHESKKIKQENGILHPLNLTKIDDLIDCREVKLSIPASDFDTQDLKVAGSDIEIQDLKYKSLRYLGFVLMSFLLLVHLTGSALIALYFSLVSGARTVLRSKGLQRITFFVFITVSSFANCGFIPTNENMGIFKKDSILLLLIIPQILFGNTLFAPVLRSVLWFLRRITEREELDYLLKNDRELGYEHLFSFLDSVLLVATVFGFIGIQLIFFCCLEWNSEVLDGLDPYQKIIGGLFQSVNSRHAGESVVDLSLLSPALLVLYIVMMYLPSYTTFLPIDGGKLCKNKRGAFLKNLLPPQLSCLAVFITIICITEKRKMFEDPLNFNVLNIVIEVISAYGNVGFSTGYSCQRLVKMSPGAYCKDASYGFSGRWSKEGKVVLIMVMFFGRLKRFSMHGSKAWVTRC